ncbi:type IV toxin-antitoxin system AbiEi family antitoxin domain-containing protein [Arthrobacter cryoconiti]|uniref:Transcriptional regulator, AbiEi antitoxin, Type IV TA system n=1 Tax=Arthrobacter cryoconiti TaxID=748907 RepID=A0ABV8R4Q2_9MICC|nr:type IV toxin-antitoxin system AbiEi family antitoxin domain-containing protein [Arthrobacter cryoconiti]MCC9069799.1 type IV toxin-antitoxin system AbiEi family antitoxin domain-containing protein [Arthrobacter cryoconiti]
MDTPRLIQAGDLKLIGHDPRQLAKRCNRGELVRVRRGTYLESGAWNVLDAASRYGLKVRAFQQQAGRPPVFCHATAAMLWGLWIVRTPALLHVIIASNAGGRSRNDIARHVGSLTDGVVECGGILLTNKLMTTLGLLTSLDFDYAVAVCDSALHRASTHTSNNIFTTPGRAPAIGQASWHNDVPQGSALLLSDLITAAQLLPSASSRHRAMAVLEFSSGLSGSAGESLSRVQMHKLGFPAPELQRRFTLRDGSSAFVDFWFEEFQTAGEFDGRGKYLRAEWGGGKPLPERLIVEKQREDQIRAQGVNFVRWTWAEMLDPNRFELLLRQVGLPQHRHH